MPTVLETLEQEIQQEERVSRPPKAVSDAMLAERQPAAPSRALFSDSLLDSTTRDRQRRGFATTVSFISQCVVVAGLLIVPLMFTEALPTAQLVTMLVAPPPPPPPPPPPAAVVEVVRQTDMLNNGELRTPTRIPRRVEMIREEEAPPPANGGVVGGIPGGVPGGQLGGVIGGIISSAPSIAMIPKLEPVKRIRISQGVTQGMVVKKVEPAYPKIALAARVTGAVLLKAVISKDGDIRELQVVSGHPMLVPAALDAVKQWHYRPYLLNGEAVEVETNITVTFQIQT
jgi:periplasmic protein TonB